jgi:DNA-binding XRE family transcriptional regulator
MKKGIRYMFNIRLEKYRIELQSNKRQMADSIGISESYYSLIESGKRLPSRTVVGKIVAISKLSEEYWMYGIKKEDINNYSFKNLERTLDTILELNVIKSPEDLFNEMNCPVDSLGRLLVEALKKDIINIMSQNDKD